MGNNFSHLTRPDWDAYASGGPPWRSTSARALDSLGGVSRAPVPRGESFNAKLNWLGDNVLDQANEIHGTLFRDRSSVQRTSANRTSANRTSPAQAAGKSWAVGSGEDERKAQLEARKRMMAYGNALSEAHSNARPGSVRTSANRHPPLRPGTSAGQPAIKAEPARNVPAPWRVRLVAARKRTLLVVLVVVRLRRGLTAPGRLRRVDSFSMYVGKALGDYSHRMTANQQKLDVLRQEANAIQMLLTNEDLHSSSDTLPQRPSTALSTSQQQSLAGKQPPAIPTLESEVSSAKASQRPTRSSANDVHDLKQRLGTATLLAPGAPSLIQLVRPGGKAGEEGARVHERSSAPADTRAASSQAGCLTVGSDAQQLHGMLSAPQAGRRGVVVDGGRPSPSRPFSAVDSCLGSTQEEGWWQGALDTTTAEAVAAATTALQRVPAGQRDTWLRANLTDKGEEVARTSQLARMYVNRAGAAWAEASTLPWRPAPPLWDGALCAASFGTRAYDDSMEELIACLREGAVAFSLLCGEDSVTLPDGRVVDVWGADPWQVVSAARPGCIPPTAERVEGVPLGARVVLQLLAAVHALAGPQAASRLTLLLHCSDMQYSEVLSDILGRRHYGLGANLIVLPQPSWPGHRWSPALRRWQRDALGPPTSLGSGYSCFLLSWVGEGLTVSPSGELVPLPAGVLEVLEDRGVRWLVMERVRDLSLLNTSGALDASGLASLLLLHRAGGANMGVWCGFTSSPVVSRTFDSVVCCGGGISRQPPVSSPRKLPRGEQARGGTAAFAASQGHGHSPHGRDGEPPPAAMRGGLERVLELRHGELVSPALQAELDRVRAQAGGLTVGVHRYAFHVPSLRALLVDFPFRPRLALVGQAGGTGTDSAQGDSLPRACQGHEALAVTWDVADLLALPAACGVALHAAFAPPPVEGPAGADGGGVLVSPRATAAALPPALCSAEDVPRLVGPLLAQDRDPAFRRMLAEHQNLRHGATVVGAPLVIGRPASVGHNIVVFVAHISPLSDCAVAAAARMARPGVDNLHLVRVIPHSGMAADGEAVLQHYHLAALGTMVQCRVELLVQHPWSLLEVMDWYCARVEAGLVVLASDRLTSVSDVDDTPAVLTSVSLAALRRLSCPIMVVTSKWHGRPQAAPLSPRRDGAAAAIAEYATLPAASVGLGSPASHPDAQGAPGAQGKAGLTNAQAAVASAVGAGGLRALVMVERHSRALMTWLCNCLTSARGDSLVLAQAVPAAPPSRQAQQRQNYRTALDAFQRIATGVRLPVTQKLQLHGTSGVDARQLSKLAEQHAVGVVAVQLPPVRGRLPRQLLQLIRVSTSPVLVFKEGMGGALGGVA